MGAIMPHLCWHQTPGDEDAPRSTENYRVVLVGAACSGKSTMVRSLCMNQHPEEYSPTLHVEVGVKTIEINDQAVVTIQLWDTPGAPQVDLNGLIYEKADAVLLVFDIGAREEFYQLEEQLDQIKSAAPTALILLCANKSDQPRHAVTIEQLLQFGCEHRLCGVVLTVAATGEGVRNALKHVIRETRHRALREVQTNLCVAWNVTGQTCGASLFGQPLSEALQLEKSRGLQGEIPLVVELCFQYLSQTGDSTSFDTPSKENTRRIAKYVEFLTSMLEQDKHGVVLEAQACPDPQVMAQWLLAYLR
eukprot:TRINITY_DN7935_c0_g1_i3.p1 TRINITY_DN7935_c0_g1~~TRINITY_DN7935_c0_g1_i3.p1  ORF type:complete len:305 (-),score=40.87 TRINITY_DN7935_c0_g1_i3:801-1715(-)